MIRSHAHATLCLASAFVAVAAPEASAEPLTLTCTITEASHPAYGLVDQIVIDVENRLIDFREAATMGTSYPRNWIFTNRLEDRLEVMDDYGAIVAFGLSGGRPLALRYETDGQLTFVAIAGADVWSNRWQCQG